MDAVPLVTSFLDARNLSSILFYGILFLLLRRLLSRITLSSCPSCFSPQSRLRGRGSTKWNNNNAVTWFGRESTCRTQESEEEGESGADANEPLVMAVTLMIFPWLPASNLFFYVGFVVAGQFFARCTSCSLIKVTSGPQSAFCTFHRWDSASLLRPEWKD